MKTIAPFVLVKIDFETHNTHTFSIGEKIQVEKKYRADFNKRYSNPDSGWVVAIPSAKEIFGSPQILNVGDYVFFHFHTFSQYNEVVVDGETYYKVNYSNIYFKYDLESKEVTPLNQFVMTNIITESCNVRLKGTTTVLKRMEFELTNKSIVAYKPPYVTTIEIGDTVYHRPNNHYDIELPDGRRLYRMREREIVGISE